MTSGRMASCLYRSSAMLCYMINHNHNNAIIISINMTSIIGGITIVIAVSYAMLCYASLGYLIVYHSMLYYVMTCYMVWYGMLCYVMLRYAMLC